MKQPNSQHNIQVSLERYGAMTGAFIGIASVAQAGVVYTDVDPDVTCIWSGFDNDMNADDVIDFTAFQLFTDLRVGYSINLSFVALSGNYGTGYGIIRGGGEQFVC